MRRGPSLLSLVLGLLLAADASAQTRERVKILNIHIGFPAAGVSGSRSGIFKAGQWAPVYVDLECIRDFDPPENLYVIVDTTDGDGVLAEGQVEITGLKLKGDVLRSIELGRVPYLKPGSYQANVSVRVKGVKSEKTFGESTASYLSAINAAKFVVLGIGTNLNGMRFPGSNAGQDDPTHNGWVQPAQYLEVGAMPDHWLGYGAADLIVLGTGGDRDFWIKLSEQQNEKRRKALVEWVRRGGRLVISIGTNADVLDALKEIKDILPATVGAKRSVTGLPFAWSSGQNSRNGLIRSGANGGEFAVVALQPRADRGARVLVTEDGGANRPLAVQGSYGLGRVTVFGFDLDKPPFVDWESRAGFWENLVNQCGYVLPSSGKLDDNTNYSQSYDQFSSGLQGSLDFFEGVPVVSFGWVALFILIYIILIGPLDYFFLKKVVRRLEWTWVTFPVIVISVSAGAYFAAYALKGKDLKTNKVDVVDIDLANKRIDGNTWFTLFSPRIQNYTIAVEPAGPIDGDTSVPNWTPANPSDAAHDSVISWQSNVERNKFGQSGSLFTKRYKIEAHTDTADINRDLYASGLEGVPIQVWTTKAFYGQWTAPIDPAKPPVVADLSVSRTDENVLVGTITNNLPVGEFGGDIALFWRGKAFALQDFPIGVTKNLSVATEQGGAEDVKTWVTDKKRYPPGVVPWTPQTTSSYPTYGNSSSDVGTTSNPNFRLWPVMFADIATDANRSTAPNASLRRLDQSWRVGIDNPEQAVLVLRVPTKEGPAEEIARSAMSPSRLWLGKLPTAGGQRPALQGTLKQETYIRVLIPVKTGPAAKR
jgi:hypothetical protein